MATLSPAALTNAEWISTFSGATANKQRAASLVSTGLEMNACEEAHCYGVWAVVQLVCGGRCAGLCPSGWYVPTMESGRILRTASTRDG